MQYTVSQKTVQIVFLAELR